MKKSELKAEIESLRLQVNYLQVRVHMLESAQRVIPFMPDPIFPGQPYISFHTTDADRTTGTVKRWTTS